MDGKKRIARIRNEQKWQRLAGLFGGKLPKPKPKPKKKSVMAVGINDDLPCKLRGLSIFTSRKLREVNDTSVRTPYGFIYRLTKRGYKILGRGAYSTVLAKDGSDRVIKVTRSMDNWIDYCLWAAKAGYAGNFAPKVYSWKSYKDNGDMWREDRRWSVAVVERMHETLNADSEASKDFQVLGALQYHVKNILAQVYMDDMVPGSAKFFVDLHTKFYASDICGKNMMVRKDGTFCVTDPVCGTSQIEKKRYRSGDFTPTLRNYFESYYRYRS